MQNTTQHTHFGWLWYSTRENTAEHRTPHSEWSLVSATREHIRKSKPIHFEWASVTTETMWNINVRRVWSVRRDGATPIKTHPLRGCLMRGNIKTHPRFGWVLTEWELVSRGLWAAVGHLPEPDLRLRYQNDIPFGWARLAGNASLL